jgi:myosin-15
LNDRYFSQPDLVSGQRLDSSGRPRSSSNLRQASGNTKLDQDDDLEILRGGRHGPPRFVKGKGRRDVKSSAMSDTSEAPSIASHIKRVRVPSQASDVDQFLDDLFSPVLDGQIMDDGLSDAKSLAASMRGGHDDDTSDEEPEGSLESNLSGLVETTAIVEVLMGGKDSPPNDGGGENLDQTPNVGFQPIQGLMSPTMSPPPMLMPTPIFGGGSNPGSMTSPLLMSVPGASEASVSGAAMAFTYVPVPVYNMAGMSAGPNMTGGMPNMSVMSPSMMSQGYPNAAPQGTSTPSGLAQGHVQEVGSPPTSQPSSLDAAQAAYQQAFLQNAVAQNMQIQQQLMMQNQALTHLLTQSPSSGAGAAAGQTPTAPMVPMHGTGQDQYVYFDQQNRKISADQILDSGVSKRTTTDAAQAMMKTRSMSTPNTPKQLHEAIGEAPMMLHPGMDPYTRARTVRIGKWRWPPPKDETQMDPNSEGFFEFKMRKMSEKKQPDNNQSVDQQQFHQQQQFEAHQHEQQKHFEAHQQQQQQQFEQQLQQQHQDSFDTSGEIQGIDWGVDQTDQVVSSTAKKTSKADSPGSGSIGKIKLSSEMKEKFEAVTGSRKNSVKSTTSKHSDHDGEIGKLDENKKLLMEQKLGGTIIISGQFRIFHLSVPRFRFRFS